MAKPDPYAALRYSEFVWFLFVRFALVFGWSMQFIVIEWQVYSLTKDPLSLGIIGLMEIIPAVSVALFAGHVVDQSEKRNLLLKCILFFSIISVGLFILTLPSVENSYTRQNILYLIYALVFLGGGIRAFFGPTIFALVALLVPKKVYPNATTWSSTSWQMASVLGPAIAGFSIFWIGVHWTLCFVFGLIILAGILMLKISPKPILNTKIGEPIFESLKAGIKFVYHTKAILAALTLDMIAVLFGGAVALLPIFAQDILHVGPEGFGFLRAAPAVGAIISMYASVHFSIARGAGMKLLMAVFGFGICIIIFGLSSIYWVSLMALLLSGMTDGVSMVIRQTILQLKTPDDMRGRVASVNYIFIGSSNELGAFESGLTAKLMGTVRAVIFGGCMTVMTVVGTGFAFPDLRSLDLTDDMEEG